MGRKITTKIRKSPNPTNVNDGPTLVTPGKRGFRGCRNPYVAGAKDSMETITIDPMIGPSMVPNPPITAMINGRKEFAALKMSF